MLRQIALRSYGSIKAVILILRSYGSIREVYSNINIKENTLISSCIMLKNDQTTSKIFLRCSHRTIFSAFGLFSLLCMKGTSKYQTNACSTDIWTILKVTKK